MFAGPTKQLAAPGPGTQRAPVLSQLNAKWFNLHVRPPSLFQTPRQKLLVAGSSMRRFTRLTNAFSKKIENHAAAVALYFMYYNFGRILQTLRVTPAMEAGVANHVWSIEEIVALLG